MKPNRLLLLAAVSALPISVASSSLADLTLSTDNGTTIGTTNTPKVYGNSYSGFWRSGAPDYSLLTTGTDTYLNAPASNGNIHFRANNAGANGSPDIMTIYGGGEVAITNGLVVSSSDTYVISVGGTTTQVGVTSQAGSVAVQGVGTTTTAIGVEGIANTGVAGYSFSGTGSGVYGENSSGGYAGYFNGKAYVTGNMSVGSFTNRSDARLKKDIRAIDSGLGRLLKLRPVTYQWRDESSGVGTQIGLIAQDVREIFPELVQADGVSGMLSVNYTALVPVAIRGLQEQQAVIDRLEARMARLEQGRSPVLASLFSDHFASAVVAGLLPLGLMMTLRRRKAQSLDKV